MAHAGRHGESAGFRTSVGRDSAGDAATDSAAASVRTRTQAFPAHLHAVAHRLGHQRRTRRGPWQHTTQGRVDVGATRLDIRRKRLSTGRLRTGSCCSRDVDPDHQSRRDSCAAHSKIGRDSRSGQIVSHLRARTLATSQPTHPIVTRTTTERRIQCASRAQGPRVPFDRPRVRRHQPTCCNQGGIRNRGTMLPPMAAAIRIMTLKPRAPGESSSPASRSRASVPPTTGRARR